MKAPEFTSTVRGGERGGIWITLPFSAGEVWGAKRRHSVRGWLKGRSFSASLGACGGEFFLPLKAALRESASVRVGHSARLRLALAQATRSHLPDELEVALEAQPGARAFLESLSPFYRNESHTQDNGFRVREKLSTKGVGRC